jgi:hypothetical protein
MSLLASVWQICVPINIDIVVLVTGKCAGGKSERNIVYSGDIKSSLFC